MERYEFVFDAPRDEVVKSILSGVVSWQLLPLDDGIRGSISKNRTHGEFYYVRAYDRGSPFGSIFDINIEEVRGKTVITGYWRLHKFMVMLIVSLFLAFPFIQLISGEFNAILIALPILLVIIVIQGIWQNKKNEPEVIDYFRTQQSIINSREKSDA